MAVPECVIEANSAASVSSVGLNSFAVTGEGVARITASKSGKAEGGRGKAEG